MLSVLWSLAIDALTTLLWRSIGPVGLDWMAPGVIATQLGLAVSSGLLVSWPEHRYHVVGAVWRFFGRHITNYPEIWQGFFEDRRTDIVYVRLVDGVVLRSRVVLY